MQSLSWYYHRLQRMSFDEVLWRVRGAVREGVDLIRIPTGRYPKLDPPADFAATQRAFTVVPEVLALTPDMRARLTAKADAVLDHRLSFFQHENLHLGDTINWHRDWNQGINTPVRPCPLVDYRVPSVSGDCKQVWEPNRHHQWVVLGRAYQVTGDERYAAGFWAQMESWLDANPFGHGMAWKNPLELGVRAINWVWALDLVRGYAPDPALWRRAHQALYQHVWDLRRKFSQGSSANNHLIGEVAGAFVACSYLPHLPEAEATQARCRDILAAEIERQLFDSGCTREQALGYQFFSLQFFTICARVAELSGKPFPPAYNARLEAGYRFLCEVSEGGDELPLFGDKDDGYVLDLGDGSHDVRVARDVYQARFGGGSHAATEHTCWLLGTPIGPVSPPPAQPLRSRAYDDAGHYFLQCGEGEGRLSMQVDCAPLGYGLLTAHGHADALAFTLRLGGLHMLVDPGTYDYFTYPAWRNAFRRTIAHNTVCVDNTDQSEIRGPFLFGAQAAAERLAWEDDEQHSVLEGRQDGYERLEDPVSVTRRYELNKADQHIQIEDRLSAAGEHAYAAAFHFHPDCAVTIEGGTVRAERAGRTLTMEMPETVCLERYHGDEDAMLGWFSPGYHRKVPATCVVARCAFSGEMKLSYSIRCQDGARSQ